MGDADAVVIGSGPNGLVAATLLARAGGSVTVLERAARPGGALHSAELTVPGYVHDPYSAFYGLLHSSPVFHELGLDRTVQWARFEVPVAAVVSPRSVALCHAEPAHTAADLARRVPGDGAAWLELYRWWRQVGRSWLRLVLGPVGAPGPALAFAARAARRGRHQLLDTARLLLGSMEHAATERFEDPAGRALLTAGASHADLSVDSPGSVPPALVLAMAAQEVGMPVPVGGAGRLAAAQGRLQRRGTRPARGPRPGADRPDRGQRRAHPGRPGRREPQPGGRRPGRRVERTGPAARVPARAGLVPLPHPDHRAVPVLGLGPPRGGVHGMVGRNCARRVLSDRRRHCI